MAESFDNINNILGHWAKDNVQKRLVEALNKYEKQWGEGRGVRFISVGRSGEGCSSSRARLKVTKPNTKLVLKLTYFKVRNHNFV